MSTVAERHALTYACNQCGASLAFAGVRTETCPYCASPNFVERPATPHQPDPRFVLAFEGDQAEARRCLQRWLGRRWVFADPAFRRARVEDLRGVYAPAYLYSAAARTEYTAQIGEHYTETETVTRTDKDGKRVTETRTVTRTEYRPLAGTHVGYVTDVLASAGAGLASSELARLGPFELRQLRRFSPAVISGWITEEFVRDPAACLRQSRGAAIEDVGLALRRYLPGDSFSDLEWSTRVDWESLEPILVPVWVLAVRYREDRPALRVVINGQTGKVYGKVPIAWWKVALALVAAAAVIAAFVWLVREPPP